MNDQEAIARILEYASRLPRRDPMPIYDDETKRAVGDLLAVIHGDGGHYIAEHGVKKACADAVSKWHGLRDKLDNAQDLLSFVERWANHHSAHPKITASEALSMIQHHPSIVAITRSYNDGKVPNTPNPWAEIERLRSEKDSLRHTLEDWLQVEPNFLTREP